MIETSSVLPQKSLVIFGNLRKISGKCSETFVWPSQQFWKIFGKWLEIFGKSLSLVCLYNKQNITCPLVDMNFIFSCSTLYLTRSLRSVVRYQVEHTKIKFISMHGHLISSIYTLLTIVVNLEDVTANCVTEILKSFFSITWNK